MQLKYTHWQSPSCRYSCAICTHRARLEELFSLPDGWLREVRGLSVHLKQEGKHGLDPLVHT